VTDLLDMDPDRPYSQKELGQLSEKDLTKLAFLRNFKNLIFFGVGASVIGYIASSFGTVGVVIGWLAIVVYVFFALEPLMGFITTAISLIAPTPGRQWKFVQLLVSGTATVFYIAFALYIYAKMIGIDIWRFIIDRV
jgi:hypothetical protein